MWRNNSTSKLDERQRLEWVYKKISRKTQVWWDIRLLKIAEDKIFLPGSAEVTVCQESSFMHQLMHEMCYATEKMRIGPSDSHYRMWFQTTISCFGQKPRWWTLWEKARLWLRQVCARELNETEPVLTYRKCEQCHQNQVAWLTWEEYGRNPVYWPYGDRYIAGRNLA
jgi:hypothetical protein